VPDFAFYSKEIAATTDPATADPAPSSLVVLDQPPLFGAYDLASGEVGRGAVFPTLGGAVVQDFGVFNEDLRLSFSDAAYDSVGLSSATVAALKILHDAVDGEYYFTDGYDIWLVRFARPNGFKYRRDLLWAAHGEDAWSYEINLVVVSKVETETGDCGLSLETVSGP
jgi:hypothetical protein